MVASTDMFQTLKSRDYFLLKKKNLQDNLSKDLVASGYTLETLPSLQQCLHENLVVHAKGIHCLYFILDPSLSEEIGIQEENGLLSNVTDVNAEIYNEEQQLKDTYRLNLRDRADFYKIQSYRHCCECLGLFLFAVFGLRMSCGHFLCDSCICRSTEIPLLSTVHSICNVWSVWMMGVFVLK